MQRRNEDRGLSAEIYIQPTGSLFKDGQFSGMVFFQKGAAEIFLAVKPQARQGIAVAGKRYAAQR